MACRVKDQVWETVCVMYQGRNADVSVCRDIRRPAGACAVLWAVKDHVAAKELVRLFAENGVETPYLSCFSWEGRLCYLFPYEEPRPVEDFSPVAASSLYDCGQMALQLVMACTSRRDIPYPLLKLMLEEKQVQVGTDGRIYLTWCLNLDHLDPVVGETDCAMACARLLVGILCRHEDRTGSMQLIERKITRSSYQGFPELYRDLKLTSAPERRMGVRQRLLEGLRKNRDRLFKLTFVVCLVLTATALLALISQAVWGDVALFRVMSHTFDQIGTELLR